MAMRRRQGWLTVALALVVTTLTMVACSAEGVDRAPNAGGTGGSGNTGTVGTGGIDVIEGNGDVGSLTGEWADRSLVLELPW